MGQKIVIVDDEKSIVALLEFNLQKAGYQVLTAMDGNKAIELAMKEKPDLLILDLMLPGMDGMDVCKGLRQKQVMIPILMLTARDDELDKILGLELGADDYMTKPFSPREVIARVKAILRRAQHAKEETVDNSEEKITIGEVDIFPENYEAYFQNNRMELTPKEFELLYYLGKNKNRVMTRERLLNAVWDYDYVGDTRIVDVHVSHLREKIEYNTRKPQYIKTIRGLGYKFEESKMK